MKLTINKSVKEVNSMENYIKNLAKKVSGIKGIKVNPYYLIKYHFSVKNPDIKQHVEELTNKK